MPLQLQISCSSRGLYPSESWHCNKSTEYSAESMLHQQEAALGRPLEHILKSWIWTLFPMFINHTSCHHLVREASPVYPWKTSNFYISRCRAATAGQLSCVTMQRHALVIMWAESTCPTVWARWQGLASASPQQPSLPHRSLQQGSPLLAKLEVVCGWICVYVWECVRAKVWKFEWI